MKFQVLVTPQAAADIEAIHEYVLHREGLGTADNVLKLLKKSVLGLAIAPYRGKEPSELEPLGPTDYLQIIAKPWRIIYFVAGQTVQVVLVADGCRDFDGLLARRLRPSSNAPLFRSKK
jgi:toxin ParE1/3/4